MRFELVAVESQIIDAARERTERGAGAADLERARGTHRSGELVADGDASRQLAVEEQPQAGGPARTVVSDGDMPPVLEDLVLGADLQDVVGLAVNQPEGQMPAALEWREGNDFPGLELAPAAPI